MGGGGMGYGMIGNIGQNIGQGTASYVGGRMSAKSIQRATDMQVKALQQILVRTRQELDPSLISDMALQRDIDRANDRLELQKQLDPETYKQRYAAEQQLTNFLTQVGRTPADELAAQTAREAMAVDPEAVAAKNKLIDAALAEAGGALPPDIQAELMKAGLEQTGQATGAATGRGAGGVILQKVLGMGGLELQNRAAGLLKTASDLDAQRQQILQNLFPRLQQQQLGNIATTSNILQQSNAMLPQAGLSGSDIANTWLARVGALNQLESSIAGVQSSGYLGSRMAQIQGVQGAITALTRNPMGSGGGDGGGLPSFGGGGGKSPGGGYDISALGYNPTG